FHTPYSLARYALLPPLLSFPTRRSSDLGNSIAILVGDLLFARASQLVAELGPKAVRIQADAFERLVLGQLNETLGPRDGEDPIEHYLGVLADKTASLIAASAHYGALFSGAPQPAADAAVEYAEKEGVAVQLGDDVVIDVVCDADTAGQTPGTDLREGVATMTVLLLRDEAEAAEIDEAGAQILDALDGDHSTDAALADVLADITAHPVHEETRNM